MEEVPLSNKEVLDVLTARTKGLPPRTVEMLDYLKSVSSFGNKYSLEKLRNKELDASLTTLAMVANTSDISLLSQSDRKRIEKFDAL